MNENTMTVEASGSGYDEFNGRKYSVHEAFANMPRIKVSTYHRAPMAAGPRYQRQARKSISSADAADAHLHPAASLLQRASRIQCSVSYGDVYNA